MLAYVRSRRLVMAILALCIPTFALAGFSVDEDPRETNIDPGDVWLPGPTCEVDDGDGSCPPPIIGVPDPTSFDMDAYAIEAPLQVCPADVPWPPGILFSFDDGDRGPGVGSPDFFTEIFFYDHCRIWPPALTRQSYYTSITESFLGLGADPPPLSADDDVDAYDTRTADQFEIPLLFSPDTPMDGGYGAGSEGNIYMVSLLTPPTVIANPVSLGVPDPENCDIDGIAPIWDVDNPEWVILFTTDHRSPCGLDPGDIYVSNNPYPLAGFYWLYADDVTDLKIAANEDQEVDIDALAVNTGGGLDVIDPYDPPQPQDPSFYKADWPNYAPSGMPDFSQDHLHWPSSYWPTTWCGPTAVSDSLWWFDSELECDKDRTAGDSVETEPNGTCNMADRLGEVPPIPGTLIAGDVDVYEFAIPSLHHQCTVTVSTCALRTAVDADTQVALYAGCDSLGGLTDLIARNDDACPGGQSEIVARLDAGKSYFVSVETSNTGLTGSYTLSLGIDCYPLVERYPEAAAGPPITPDDHSEHNPASLIEDLAICMNTDDLTGTGSGHKGTRITEMQVCIDQWLHSKGLQNSFTEETRRAPLFDEVALEVERSEDVILLLGFYWNFPQTDQWIRCGGHYVTVAGVNTDPDGPTISFSDPALNNAEPPNSAAGRVRGPDHINHAPAGNPPDHDDAQNISHDQYDIGPSLIGMPVVAQWSISDYATAGGPTTCLEVGRWCSGDEWGQNPYDDPFNPPPPEDQCPDLSFFVSVEVEAMVDVSPIQTPVCLYLENTGVWPDNLRVRKGNCSPALETIPRDVIRGKLCNLSFSMLTPMVDLGHVQCLYNDTHLSEWEDLSPDHTECFSGWFYLVRQSGSLNYGYAYPGGEPRVPGSGGCP